MCVCLCNKDSILWWQGCGRSLPLLREALRLASSHQCRNVPILMHGDHVDAFVVVTPLGTRLFSRLQYHPQSVYTLSCTVPRFIAPPLTLSRQQAVWRAHPSQFSSRTSIITISSRTSGLFDASCFRSVVGCVVLNLN